MANNGVEHVFGDKSLNPSFKDSLCTSGVVGSPSLHHQKTQQYESMSLGQLKDFFGGEIEGTMIMMIMTTMTMEIYILFYFMLAQASHNHSHRLFSFTSYFVEFVQKYTYFSSYFLHLFLTLFRICTYSSFSETYSYAHILLFLRLFLLRIFRFLQNLFLCTTCSSPTQRNVF